MATAHNFVNTVPTPKTLDLHDVLARIHRQNERLSGLVDQLRGSVVRLSVAVDELDGQRPSGEAGSCDESNKATAPYNLPEQMSRAIDEGGALASDAESLIGRLDNEIDRLNRRIGSPSPVSGSDVRRVA